MSKVLSVYNDWAFYEIVLPASANTDYSFLLDAEFFHLKNNILVSLECNQGKWRFSNETNNISIESIDKNENTSHIAEHGRYRLTTFNGENLTILVEDKNNPLNVYKKYIFVPGKSVSIGLDFDNTIQYSYPLENNIKNFVSHHHCKIYYDGSSAYIEDTSSNGTYVNNKRVNGKKQLNFGDSIRIFGLNIIYLGSLIAVNTPKGICIELKEAALSEIELFEEEGNKQGSSQKTLFFRAPRILPRIITEPIEIDPPPAPRDMPNMPIFMQIGPAITMTIPMLLGSGLTVAASRMGGTANTSLMAAGIVTAVASAGVGAFWAVMNMRFNKKIVLEGEERRFNKYGKYLIDKQKGIEEIYNINSNALREKYISSEQIASYNAANEKLWNRNFSHGDVLTYRLGIGNVPMPIKIEIPKQKFTMIDDSLAEKPQKIKERFNIMRDVPVCIDLKNKNLIGIIGETSSWGQIIRNLIVQVAGNNSYTDVKIAFVYDSNKISNAKSWDFVKWLPHTWSEDKRIRFYATNKNEAGEVFYAISQTMRTRVEEEKGQSKPYFLLFVLNKELLEGELILKYIGSSSDIGMSTIIAAEKYEYLPNNCEFIIENSEKFSGVYNTIDESVNRVSIKFDKISDEASERFAKCLANIEVDEDENGGEIPSSVSFFEMYGISKPDELRAEERWRKAKTSETMKAVIGLKNGSQPCYLDIHERYHGPHGLVAGTTGSGKSETLQTYMLSLAINYSPDDIGFFIIDYKGGGMANLFEGLPHVIGAISNLSGNQIKRAMVSIKSENKRRQRIFSDYGVNNINAYTLLYKNGDTNEPIPHMFIIIDEFAELKREEPEFMRELVSVAQVGRSLGVHLILATQKPAGTVDDNIWSNSKFRLCLRVQDRQDSMDMLHRADAAYLTQTGRGYLQVGNDEIFELFQSGYSGAVYDEYLGDKKVIVSQMLDSTGKVDLAGNHFKIKHQQEVQYNWVSVLYKAFKKAVNNSFQGKTFDETIFFSDNFIKMIYKYIAEFGMDFKRSQYNDIRLKEFAQFAMSLKTESDLDTVKSILNASAKNKIRLPELKNKTQLEAIKEYLHNVANDNGYTHVFTLWMPVLPEHIVLMDIEGYSNFEYVNNASGKKWTLDAIIGKGDDPENQNQMPISIDFASNGHHALCGTVSTGKSTFLQTAVYSFINKYSSDEINIYIIDFSAKLLNVFEASKHVGGIMTDAEEDKEKISKFFTMVSGILKERKKLFAASNFRDYVEHSSKKIPAILIVIDNYTGFKEKTEEKHEDLIRKIAKEGISHGIYLLVAAGGFGTSEIPLRLADSFRTTICLEMSDIYQYSDVMRVVKAPIYPEPNIKGRGLVHYGDKIIEFQTALACEGDSAFDRNDAIRERILKINRIDTGKPAKRIPVIPDKPIWDDYIKQEDYINIIKDNRFLPNGYNSETAAYSAIDLTSMLTYAISGTKKSGKSTYMKTLILSCIDKDSEVCIIEIGSSEFAQIASNTGCRYITDGQGIYDYAKNVLLAEAGIRADKKKECMALHLDDTEFFEAMLLYRRHCIFIPNMTMFLKELYNRESKAFDSVNVYEILVGEKGYHYNFYFFAEINDNDIGEILGYKFMQSFKDNGRGIRFGGKYLSQKLFSYANLPYKIQGSSVKPGIGVVPSEEETSPIEQIVVPNYKG